MELHPSVLAKPQAAPGRVVAVVLVRPLLSLGGGNAGTVVRVKGIQKRAAEATPSNPPI